MGVMGVGKRRRVGRGRRGGGEGDPRAAGPTVTAALAKKHLFIGGGQCDAASWGEQQRGLARCRGLRLLLLLERRSPSCRWICYRKRYAAH